STLSLCSNDPEMLKCTQPDDSAISFSFRDGCSGVDTNTSELSDREKVRRTVDARLWLQAKTALKKANEIVKARGQDQRLENCKKIRLETINKTFVNRGTSPIIFESPCERNSVGEFQIGNVKTEIELLESDDDKCQVIEIDSKMEDKLLRDDDEDNRIVSFSTC
ncbi:hypothetical protein KQX54_000946, partial [Cotesia glomerata]